MNLNEFKWENAFFCSTWNLHLEALKPVGRECDECSPFIWTESSDWSLTKLYGNGFFLSMLSSKHFQTNSSGLPSLCVTAKRILSLCSIFCLSRFIFLRSPSCNFTQADCLECMAQTVATEGAVKKMWKTPTFPPIVRIIWELLLW